MSVLTVNLRQFYQRWVVLLIYGGVILVTSFIVAEGLFDSRRQEGAFAGLLILIFPLGVLVAIMQMEVLSKPLSCCLPGHHGVLRRLVLVIGLPVAVLFSLPFMGYPGLFHTSPAWWALVLCSAFCANLLVYMAGLVLGFTMRNATAFVAFLPSLAVLAPISGVHAVIERLIVRHPVAVLSLTAVTVGAGWWWLSRPAWFHRRCGQYWTELFSFWDRRQIERHRQFYAARRFAKLANPAIDHFFERAVGRHRPSDLRKYVLGALYPVCIMMAVQWKGVVFITLLAVIWACYSPSVAPFVIAVVPLMIAGVVELPLRSVLLVAGGRRERFLASAAMIVGLGVAAMLVIGAAVALTRPLASLVPDIQVKGVTLRLQPIRFTMVLVPLAVLPLMNLVRILFYRHPVLWGLAMMPVFLFVFMSSTTPLGRLVTLTPATAVAVIVVLWGLCLATIHRIAMRSDLVRE